METNNLAHDTITLESPDGQFSRRINPDGSFQTKTLGMEWEKHDPDYIERAKVAGYVATMVKRLKWKVRYSV